MLNLFKLPFRFGSSEDKPSPNTDIAIGIFKNYQRRFKSNQRSSTENEYGIFDENHELSESKLNASKEAFYELMTQNLRKIEKEFKEQA